MAFESRGSAESYQPRQGDNLEAVAERATAEGNPVTWQEISTFNFGTDDAEEVETLKRDVLGCRHRNEANEMVVSEDDPRARGLVIPKRFQARTSLAVDRPYQLRIRKKECPKQFLACTALPAITFATKSSFIRPSVVAQLAHLEGQWKRHPEAKVMIFGHADKQDDHLFNKKLSERRAWAAHAFVVKDASAWETLYNHDDEVWGVPVIQEILADLGHDPGDKATKLNDETRDAMRSFLGLAPDAHVDNDAAFRLRLFSAYMEGKHAIELPEDCFVGAGYMGCGEYNPVFDAEEDAESNRRVTFYFFHPERVPAFPCRYADVEPCKTQLVSLEHRHKPTFGCSFYDSMACRCKQESIPVVTDFWVIIATYGDKPSSNHSAKDWFHLTSKDGATDLTHFASDAVPHKGAEQKIEFKAVKTGSKFTLRHYIGDACWTVFEDLSYIDLIDLDLAADPIIGRPDQPGLVMPKVDTVFGDDGTAHLLPEKPAPKLDDDCVMMRTLRNTTNNPLKGRRSDA
jgi:outer membrane protein OmpA-like peptidoglycan-associated protein